MDQLQLYELYDLLDLLPWSSAVSNNQMRYIVWASLKPYLKKKSTTPSELFPLPTDEDSIYVEIEKEKPLAEQEIINIREEILKQFNGGH